MIEKLVNKKTVYSGWIINVRNDTVSLPNKKTSSREYIEHPGAVAALTFYDKNTVVLIRQYRYPIDEITWEIPAGKFDFKESPTKCIKRELAEETGYQARHLKLLLKFWPTCAFSTEIIHIYAAWGLYSQKANPDEDEFIEVKLVPLKKCYEWIKKGIIKDSKTIIALLTWAKYKNKLKIF